MPAYRTHVAVNLFVGLPLSVAALKYAVLATPVDMCAFAAIFLYGTLFLSPDADLAHKNRLFSLKGLLTLPFRPYSYLCRHRGLSHMPLIGTLTRVLWLLFLLSALGYIYPAWDKSATWFALGGLIAADLFHILLDQI